MMSASAFSVGWRLCDPLNRNQPQSNAVATAERLRILDCALKKYFSSHRQFSPDLSALVECGLIRPDDALDIRGREWLYDMEAGDHVVISSEISSLKDELRISCKTFLEISSADCENAY